MVERNSKVPSVVIYDRDSDDIKHVIKHSQSQAQDIMSPTETKERRTNSADSPARAQRSKYNNSFLQKKFPLALSKIMSECEETENESPIKPRKLRVFNNITVKCFDDEGSREVSPKVSNNGPILIKKMQDTPTKDDKLELPPLAHTMTSARTTQPSPLA